MAGGCCSGTRIGGAAVATGNPGTKGTPGEQRAAAPSREWQTCLNGPPEPGIAACSALIRTRVSGTKKLNPDDIGWAYGTRASHYAGQGNHARALADVEESIRLREPKNLTFAYFVRGLIFRDQGDHRRAIADFTKAIELNPKADFAFAARGRSHLITGEIERGNADYQTAIQASPDSRTRYEAERELLVDWLAYLKEIQDAGDYANWSAPPLDGYRVSGR
jgi:tetratricopeptide (TPR) repeat protein